MQNYTLEVKEGDAAAINNALGHHLEWQQEDGLTGTQQYADSVEAFHALGNLVVGTITVALSEGAHEEALCALDHHCEVFGDAYPEWDQWDPAYRAALALGANESELAGWPWCLACGELAPEECAC